MKKTISMKSRFSHILITGASSGIGKALALAYAQENIRLTLCGRSVSRLEEVRRACIDKGACVNIYSVDITDAQSVRNAIILANRIRQIDLVIANAGIAGTQEESAFSRQVINTNVIGVFNTVSIAAELMKQNQYGQIGLMSSLASFRALGGPPGYAASKAWVRLYGEALRGRLARYGVGVSVICPGYVATPMTSDMKKASRIRMTSALDAARMIKIGLEKNKSRISFSWRMAFKVWLLSSLPVFFTDRQIKKKWQCAQNNQL